MNFKYLGGVCFVGLSYTGDAFLKNPENQSSMCTPFPISFKFLLKIFYRAHIHIVRVCAPWDSFFLSFIF